MTLPKKRTDIKGYQIIILHIVINSAVVWLLRSFFTVKAWSTFRQIYIKMFIVTPASTQWVVLEIYIYMKKII